MRYQAFGDYARGYSHVKNGTECEDHALSYSDPDGRYQICAACDGHNDKNCFRSAKGARYGCESAVEVLTRFCELYLDQAEEERTPSRAMEERLKRSLKQSWEKKVQEDVKEYPLMPEELEPLTDRVRGIYESGQGLSNIYGATFLAAAVCGDLFIALHIGDGVLLCVDPDGTYYDPLPEDPKSDTGSPASLCDTDLFTRKEAFRILMTDRIPQAVVVSSDGIGDCMDELQFREFVCELFTKFKEQRTAGGPEGQGLNEEQGKYLKSCVEHWAAQGKGVEDDCSLAGIYDPDAEVPKVRLPLAELERRWNEAIAEQDEMIRDYERRKKETLQNIERRTREAARIDDRNYKDWVEAKERLEETKQTLRNIQKNELEKAAYYEKRLEGCREYFRRSGNVQVPDLPTVRIQKVEERYLEEDPLFAAVKDVQKAMFKQKALEKEARIRREKAQKAQNEAFVRWKDAWSVTEERKAQKEMDRTRDAYRRADEELRRAEETLKKAQNVFQETVLGARRMERDSGKKSSFVDFFA